MIDNEKVSLGEVWGNFEDLGICSWQQFLDSLIAIGIGASQNPNTLISKGQEKMIRDYLFRQYGK